MAENNNSDKVSTSEKTQVKSHESSDRILVSHGTGVYDVTTFAEIHPGGREYLTRFKNKVRILSNYTDQTVNSGYFKCYGWKDTSTWSICISLDGPI